MPDFNQQQVFLFMPDISGFTHFVNETDIEHSALIIQELLEVILDANEIGMEMLEIEGDAVFFFRLGELPTANEIIFQAKRIFKKFHQHLLQYESRRICQCGACRTANNLTLKFIVHTGLVGSYFVRKQFKLIGNDIILLHRLLKNKIPINEYLLFTEPFFDLINNQYLNERELSPIDESGEYDGAMVHYKYVPIKKWIEEIEVIDEENNTFLTNLVSVIDFKKEIDAPADEVFSYIADLSKRVEWMGGIRKIEFISKEKINQAGTVHKCILDNNRSNIFKSNYFEHGENDFSIIELDIKKGIFAHKFDVESLSSQSCKVRIQFLVKNNLFQKLIYSIFKKNKVENRIRKSLNNLEMKFK